MKVLSLFDGISCGRIALERAGIKVDNYYSSEIDKYAIQVADNNYPQDSDKRLGDVTKWRDWDINWSNIDLVTGGFPCQAWSTAGKQLGDKDERGMLFWTMLDIMKKVLEANPKAKFLMENVKMKKEFEEYITLHTENALGTVYKHLINSALVSAQNRERYYWTNIEGIEQPEDKNIFIKDIVYDDSYKVFTDSRITKTKKITKNYIKWDLSGKQYWSQQDRAYYKDGKICTLPKSNPSNKLNVVVDYENDLYRRLHPIEAERCQTVPDNYTLCDGISEVRRLGMLGNGWTVDIIAHIFKGLK